MLEWFKTLLAAQKAGSVTEAASQLHITQPAATKRIMQLEEHFGVKVFDRVGKRLKLTEAGRVIYRAAEAILEKEQNIVHELSLLQKEPCGVLTIGASHYIGLYFLPKWVRQYQRRYPKVTIKPVFATSMAISDAVLSGDCDVGLIASTPGCFLEHLCYETVCGERFKMVIAKHHQLAKQLEITWQALYALPLFLPEAGSPAYQWVSEVLLKRHFKHCTLAEPINMFETIARMVGSGLGWSILPENCCRGLYEIPLLKQTVYYDIGIVRHKRVTLSHAGKAFASMIDESTCE